VFSAPVIKLGRLTPCSAFFATRALSCPRRDGRSRDAFAAPECCNNISGKRDS